MNRLHITNGDVAADLLREARIEGEVLPWRDVLHDGPVPAGLGLHELSRIRARYIADCGWAGFEDALADFQARDTLLESSLHRTEVTLWFEHDLYDQLQLLQLLDWFAVQAPGTMRLSLICSDQYLGRLPAAGVAALFPAREPVTVAQLQLAQQAWRAFRAPEPEDWQALLDEDTSALPFLTDAVLRHLEQFPSVANGLNRTETQLLEAVSLGIHAPWKIFDSSQLAEDRVFMGDASFFLCMKAMFEASPPLLCTADNAPFRLQGPDVTPARFAQQAVRLTEAGERILKNELDWVALKFPGGGFDRWLGGVHLHAGHMRRWDHDTLSLQLASA